MSWLKLFSRKKNSQKRDTEITNLPAPSNPWSQVGIRSSKPTPSTLPRRKSEDDTTPEIPSASGHHLPAPNIDGGKSSKLSTYTIDPTAAYQNKSDLGSTGPASARLAIDLLKESSDVLTPLKSVAGGLSAVLKYYDQAAENRKSIASLIPRVEGLAESLSAPPPEGEIKEIKRRQELKEKLNKARRDLESLAERGKIKGFLNNVEDAKKLSDLAQDIRDAMMEYQTALQQDIYHKNHQIIDASDRSLLNGMQHTTDAGYRCGNRQGCLKGTRKEVLLDIERWLMDEGDKCVFWLNGLAGTGKSTIAQTFAEISFADGKLGASFFCSRDFENRNNLGAIFPTLAFQLAYQYPPFRKQLLQVLRANPDVGQESLSSQLEKVIVRPFQETKISTLIIIDALDECKDKEPASALLSVLSRHVHEIPWVKFFITGRPEPPIREGFRLESLHPITDVLKLHDVERSSVDEDIKLYLRTYLTDIRTKRSDCEFPTEWPYPYDIDFLCKKAGGLFIYASTVVKFVASKYHTPTNRLDLIIERSKEIVHEGGVDLLYTQILQLAFQDADPGERELYSHFRSVVGAVLLAINPLSRKTLSILLGDCGTPSQISTALRFLHSLLNVPDNEDEPIRVFHKSFPDFLTDRTRCKDDRFFVDPAVHHEDMLFSCLELMKKRLKNNICDLDDYAVLSEVNDLSARREAYIGSPLEYACRFWTRHLAKVPGGGPHARQVQEAVDKFFAEHLLLWVEVLSVMGHLSAAVYAINDIRQWYLSAGISTCKQADDSERLILEYFDAIRDSPSHIYHSALPLSPSSSWLRERYETKAAGEVSVLMGLPDQWDTCSRTILLEGRSIAFAHWRDIIATAMESNVVLLDAITGIRSLILSGHSGRVSSLEFSLDGTLLISNDENAINLWDVQTGGVIRTFGDDNSRVSAASISSGGTTIAVGTKSGTIHLWDVRTGRCHSVETGSSNKITTIRFSPVEPQRLISLSRDGIIQQWDVGGHRIGSSYHEPDVVCDLAYALDGTRFIYCGGRIATVRNTEDGAVVVKLNTPDKDLLNQCCFSPDGRFVAGSTFKDIFVWDITATGASTPKRLVGHSGQIYFITFSSSLISGSNDQSVKFWQGSSFLTDPATTNQVAAPPGPIPIVSLKLFAKDGILATSDSSGTVKTWDLMTGSCKSSFPTPAEGQRDTHLEGDSLIIVWYTNGCHVWDVYKGQLLRRFKTSRDSVLDLKISGDGSKIFLHKIGSIEAVSMQTGEGVGNVKLSRRGGSCFIVRGSKVTIDRHRAGWDFGDPKIPSLKGFPDRPRLDLVDTHWIKDTITKRQVFRLPEKYTKRGAKVEWEGRYLLLLSPSGEMMVIDFDLVCPLS